MPNYPPNILFVQSDQLSASILPACGNAIAKTPRLDELAGPSTVFKSAYTNFPLCAPSRFSMMPGRLASRIGACAFGADTKVSQPNDLRAQTGIAMRGVHKVLAGLGLEPM